MNREYEDDSMYDSFTITKEDMDIYDIFNELYEDLINCRIFISENRFLTNDELECEKDNELERKNGRYNDLVHNNIIEWYSDEQIKTEADCVRISKKEDVIVIEFIKQSLRDDMGYQKIPGSYTIRFRTSRSRYTPCQIIFCRHLINLLKLDLKEAKQQQIIKKYK